MSLINCSHSPFGGGGGKYDSELFRTQSGLFLELHRLRGDGTVGFSVCVFWCGVSITSTSIPTVAIKGFASLCRGQQMSNTHWMTLKVLLNCYIMMYTKACFIYDPTLQTLVSSCKQQWAICSKPQRKLKCVEERVKNLWSQKQINIFKNRENIPSLEPHLKWTDCRWSLL